MRLLKHLNRLEVSSAWREMEVEKWWLLSQISMSGIRSCSKSCTDYLTLKWLKFQDTSVHLYLFVWPARIDPLQWRHQFRICTDTNACAAILVTIIQALTCCSNWNQATLPQVGIYIAIPCGMVAFRLLECILEAIWVSYCIRGDSHRSYHLLVHQYGGRFLFSFAVFSMVITSSASGLYRRCM